ncbi:lipase 1-like [Coccinella septempunctata]|uniref:lipase 1-like n=1 Tax=Coccinella septempunctata TaxID=41139 RepID=UPI001D07719D|nr:lipase 1-like [Coccinella septempunctata]
MKADFSTFLIFCIGAATFVGQGINTFFPSIDLTTEELIRSYGYPVEIHDIATEDGYILSMLRIPSGKNSNRTNSKPILLMHGLTGQAENFVLNVMNNASLAFHLADNDYDVWLGNSRGNTYGRRHKYLTIDSGKFWNFSFHEIGYYDIPAKIDHILGITGHDQLEYVGHSQGGIVFFIMSSLRPQYQQKIKLASLLGPGGYENHFTNPWLLPFTLVPDELYALSQNIKVYEFPPREIFMVLPMICQNKMFRDICVMTNYLLFGNSGEFNEEMMPYVAKQVSSVSVKQLLHFAQIIASGHFRPWDYGLEENKVIYGRDAPSDYNISSISVPTAMYYSLGDNLADYKDVENMCGALQNCVRKFLMPNKKWNHVDFLFSKTAKKELYDPLIEFSEQYDS